MKTFSKLPFVLAPLFVLPLTVSCGTSGPSDFGPWPVRRTQYELQPLTELFTASFVRGDAVVVGRVTGEVVRLSDADPTQPAISLGKPDDGGSNLLFITQSGAILSAAYHRPMFRTDDDGKTWTQVLDTPCWRMDEDDRGNLYAGNYTKDKDHVATLFKSTDDGRTWMAVFRQTDNDHLHTVRWDDLTQRLYIAFGDSGTRGQAYSDDRGETFHMIMRGPDQGFTDLAITDNYLMWCSDDGTGRVYRDDRRTGQGAARTRGTGYMWFGVAEGRQAYVGSVASRPGGGDRGVLLATNNEGDTWTKILVTRVSTDAYGAVIHAESRRLSPAGWLYFTADMEDGAHSFRVRHIVN